MNIRIDNKGDLKSIKKIEIDIPGTGTTFRIRLNRQRDKLTVTKVNDEDNSILVHPLVGNQLELF